MDTAQTTTISLSGLETFFAVCAIIGGVLFIARLILQFIGASHGADTAGDVTGEVNDMSEYSNGDSDVSFKLLSFQGLTAFFLMFGLVGFAMLRQNQSKAWIAITAASFAGLTAMWVIKKIFDIMLGLQSSGNLNIQNTLGKEGTVYLSIKKGQTGKVNVVVQNSLKLFDAVSDSTEDIQTGARVKVTKIIGGNILLVEKI